MFTVCSLMMFSHNEKWLNAELRRPKNANGLCALWSMTVVGRAQMYLFFSQHKSKIWKYFKH